MGKNIEHKKATDEQGLSDQEIWWKIRYLDPDIKRSDSVVTITVLAILARALLPQPGRAEAFHRRGLCVRRGHLAQHRGPIPLRADQGRAGSPGGLDGHRSIQP